MTHTITKFLAWFVSGAIFGMGLCVSGMIHPHIVQAFLDVVGAWDPTLLFVLGGAVLTTFIGYRLVLTRRAPLLSERFHLPANSGIDTYLIVGAALFGVGWGLLGYCPGPAIVNLASLRHQPFIFVMAMIAGNRLADLLESVTNSRAD